MALEKNCDQEEKQAEADREVDQPLAATAGDELAEAITGGDDSKPGEEESGCASDEDREEKIQRRPARALWISLGARLRSGGGGGGSAKRLPAGCVRSLERQATRFESGDQSASPSRSAPVPMSPSGKRAV